MDTVRMYKTVEAGKRGGIHAYICAQKRCRKATICTAQCGPKRPFARHTAVLKATICTAHCGPQSDYLRDTMRSAEGLFAWHSAFRRATFCTAQCVPQSDHLHGTVRSAERPFARHSAFRRATIGTAQCGQVNGHMHGTVRSVERQLAWQNATDWEARHSVLGEATGRGRSKFEREEAAVFKEQCGQKPDEEAIVIMTVFH